MINYKISYSNPHRHFIDFEITTSVLGHEKMLFQLAAWRPGRYELGNFSQNIQKWTPFNKDGKKLEYRKVSKDLWEVNTKDVNEVIIRYNFYANQLDAGGCYLDEHQLYLNPVQCMFYIVDRINDDYIINFDIPNNYLIASSLECNHKTLTVKGYDDLAESPIICSDSLQHDKYCVNDINFHLWFQGDCKIDWVKIKKDFVLFTESQITKFGGFPVDEYHFLFQITPYKSYHGVEHTKNTVILLGPGKEIMKERYEELLGVCSHELYHTWNIKSIRPIEMFPYDYTQENYFRTGFVAEGVTTYMGDLMLYNSGVFNWDEFIKTQNQNLSRHLMNYGRNNLSVADSGFDSWLDGYKLGSPNRKVSIYPDAALCMLMIDLEIIKISNGDNSLHSVMKDLYHDFALKNKGYSESDFKNICIKYGGEKVDKIFNDHIYGIKDYLPTLRNAIEYVGLKLVEKKNPNLSARYFGFIAIREQDSFVVKKVEPNSIADKLKIAPEDRIIPVNQHESSKDLNDILESCQDNVMITVKKKFSKQEILIPKGDHYKLAQFIKIDNPLVSQVNLRKIWLG
ncbi:MAG: hypothetical protein CMP51_05765 [Flavobacteriales bacterium]|nr:hypothetical protein [Flavobacteriales bacterium]|tara:strand:+ start:33 stop:1736 length:1704 start_codon:yes stop_codon:yes gene_type:complete